MITSLRPEKVTPIYKINSVPGSEAFDFAAERGLLVAAFDEKNHAQRVIIFEGPEETASFGEIARSNPSRKVTFCLAASDLVSGRADAHYQSLLRFSHLYEETNASGQAYPEDLSAII